MRIRHARPIAALAAVSVALLGAVLTTAPGHAAPTAPAAVPTDLVAIRTLTSLTATHQWYAQTFRGLPVVDGYYARHIDTASRAVTVDDGRLAVPATLATTPAVSADTAAKATAARLTASAAQRRADGPKGFQGTPTQVRSSRLSVLGGTHPALVWAVTSLSADGVTRTLVDAATGAVREVRVLSKSADGKGRVFVPNPVVTLRNGAITDKADTNQLVLFPAHANVILNNLDGDGMLHGAAVRITKAVGGLATSPANRFVYLRADDRFEQVNAYYGIDISQAYLQRLGFSDANNEPQKVEINTFAGDNSFYDPSTDTITYGRGGVDDAEDQEVVWHEYGHAIQDAIVPGYGTTEQAGAIGEGFGDYWAVTMSIPTSRGFDLPCVMDWDATSYTSGPSHCLRRVDGTKTVADIDGEVHDDGEIWSRALWDINRGLGRWKADRVIIESTYFYGPGTSFAAAARKVVAAARALYGADAAAVAKAAFMARGIL